MTMIILGNVLAVVLYSVGLISPLTPSEGSAGPTEILIFGLAPVLLLAACIAASKSMLLKVIFFVQLMCIVGVTSWLLWLQHGTS